MSGQDSSRHGAGHDISSIEQYKPLSAVRIRHHLNLLGYGVYLPSRRSSILEVLEEMNS